MRAAALGMASLVGACAIPAAELVTSRCTGQARSDGEALYAICSPEVAPQLRRLDADGTERWSIDVVLSQLATPPGDELVAIDRQDIIAIDKATGAIRPVHRILGGEVESIVLAGTTIYWIETVGTMWTLHRVPLAGGIATRVRTTPQRMSSLGADADAVYWLENEGTGSDLHRLDLGTGAVSQLNHFLQPSALQPLLMTADSIFLETGTTPTSLVLDVHRLRRPLFEGNTLLGYAHGTLAVTDQYLLFGNGRIDLVTDERAGLFPNENGSSFFTIAALADHVYWNTPEGLWRWPIELEATTLARPDEYGPPLVGHPR